MIGIGRTYTLGINLVTCKCGISIFGGRVCLNWLKESCVLEEIKLEVDEFGLDFRGTDSYRVYYR